MTGAWDLLQPQLGRYASTRLRITAAHDWKVVLDDGRELVDLNAGYWTCALGYSAPALEHAAQRGFATLPYAHLYHRAHVQAARLAEELRSIMPPGTCSRVLFANDGTSATEIALRIVQRRARGEMPLRVAVLERGYHGDSIVVRRVGDYPIADDPPPAPWLEVVRLPGADGDVVSNIEKVQATFESARIAAVFVETMQSVGGVRVIADEYLRALAALCDQHDALFIVDEIATGFGRTGTMFGFEHAALRPDLTLLGKAITGGFFPLAAVLAGERVAPMLSEEFVHGHTTTGHPVGCEIAVAVIGELRDGKLIGRSAVSCERVRARLQRALDRVAIVRGRGSAIGVDVGNGRRAATIRVEVERRGYLLGQEASTLTLIPPFTMPEGILREGADALVDVIGLS